MNQDVTSLKPLLLSEEETMALLDLCLTSTSEMDDAKEQAVQKLTELARRHLRGNGSEDQITTDTEPLEATGNEPARPLMIGETLWGDPLAFALERLTPITMTARSRTPRRQMGAALSETRSRLRKTA